MMSLHGNISTLLPLCKGNPLTKGQLCGVLMFSVLLNWTNCYTVEMLLWYQCNAHLGLMWKEAMLLRLYLSHVYNLHFLFSIIILHTSASHLQEYSTIEPDYYISIIMLLTLCTLSSSGKWPKYNIDQTDLIIVCFEIQGCLLWVYQQTGNVIMRLDLR